MTQTHFDFVSQPNQEAKEIQKWVERHNQQVIAQASIPSTPPGSLLGAINEAEAKSNAVYLLRGVLGQQLRKSMGSSSSSLKKGFLQALKGEITLKKSNQDTAQIVRDILIKMQISR
jgi:hypothetical protein